MSKVIRKIIDVLNIVIGLAVVTLTVMAFMDTANNSGFFSLIFLLGAAANFFTAIKSAMTDRRGPAILLFIFSFVLAGVSVVTYMAIGGI